MKRRYYEYLLLIVLSVVVFYLCFNSTYPLDTYYHIKAGEVYTQKGIIFHDVFSFTEKENFWSPYEWLFQVGIYCLQQVVGTQNIAIFVSIISVLQVLVLYFFLKRIFKTPSYLLFVICLCYTFGTSFYLNARPTLVANFFLITTTSLLLLYLKDKKNLLWLTIPIALAWINMHASFTILIFLLVSYVLLCFVLFRITKNQLWFHKAKVLSLYTLGIALLSFTPPLYGTTYQLLWLFAQHSKALSIIIEWQPIYSASHVIQFVGYTVTVGIIIATGVFIRKKIQREDLLLSLPLWVMVATPYISYRNIMYGWIGIAFFLAYIFVQLKFIKHKILFSVLSLGIIFGFVIYDNHSILFKYSKDRNPSVAASFILKYHLKGNMYNDLDFGDYLLYRLYPQQKVFIDGRSEVYLCCELIEKARLDHANLTPSQYKQAFLSLLNKHKIAFVITTRDSASLVMVHILEQDPAWSLVFWDDNAHIFVRRHDGNDDIIKRFGAVVAKPDTTIYDHKHPEQAIHEYKRMIQISDSEGSRNSLGSIYYEQYNVPAAKEEFQKAIQVDNTIAAPYVNLGLIAIEEKDYAQAVTLFREAINQGTDKALPYVVLGNLYVKVYGDTASAKGVWQQGLQKVTDQNGRAQLAILLSSE